MYRKLLVDGIQIDYSMPDLKYIPTITNYLCTDLVIISILFTRVYQLLFKEEEDRDEIYKNLSFISPILLLLSSIF